MDAMEMQGLILMVQYVFLSKWLYFYGCVLRQGRFIVFSVRGTLQLSSKYDMELQLALKWVLIIARRFKRLFLYEQYKPSAIHS
jgi:hypothetical protein